MLSALERGILRMTVETGFVSESDLTRTQIKSARAMLEVGILQGAGTEPDKTPVYRVTDKGKQTLGDWG